MRVQECHGGTFPTGGQCLQAVVVRAYLFLVAPRCRQDADGPTEVSVAVSIRSLLRLIMGGTLPRALPWEGEFWPFRLGKLFAEGMAGARFCFRDRGVKGKAALCARTPNGVVRGKGGICVILELPLSFPSKSQRVDQAAASAAGDVRYSNVSAYSAARAANP